MSYYKIDLIHMATVLSYDDTCCSILYVIAVE